MKDGIDSITDGRNRQIEEEEWTAEHDRLQRRDHDES